MDDLVGAAQTNDLDRLRRLVKEEKARIPGPGPTSAMLVACCAAARQNHPAALDVLLDDVCWVFPDTIIEALDGKSKGVFDSLIARGWDVSSNLGHCGDALIDDLDMVQFLLSRGADPNANFTSGASRALELAAYWSSIPILKALLDAGAELKLRSALRNAAGEGRIDAVLYLLDRGAVIDEIPDNNDILENALELGVKNAPCQAAWKGQAAVVKLLLERGADASVRDTNGKSALQLAESGGHSSYVDILQGIGSKTS